MAFVLQLASTLVGILLIVLILLQVKGGALGGMLGGEMGITHTRRGFERTLFQITVGLSIIFMAISLFSVAFASS